MPKKLDYLVILLFFSITNGYGSVFNDIEKSSKNLSDEILSAIDGVLTHSSRIVDLPNTEQLKTDPLKFVTPSKNKNLCYDLSFFDGYKLDLRPRLYSFSKISFIENSNNKIDLSVRNSSNLIQLSFFEKGHVATNSYFGNSRGVESLCVSTQIAMLPSHDELKLNEGYSGILIKTGQIIDQASVNETNYEKLYLDSDLKVITKRGDATKVKYTYFRNIAPGNIELKLGIQDKGYVSEIIHLIHDEVTFIDDKFSKIKNRRINFFKKNLMANKRMPENIFKVLKSVNNGNFESNLVKNSHVVSETKLRFSKLLVHNGVKISGKHLYYNIGDSDHEIVIPSNDYANLFFETNNLDTERKFCIVEIPLPANALKIDVSNSDGDNLDSPDLIVKDRYGNMSGAVSEKSDVIYIVGYLNGVIDYKIQYKDNSNQYGQVPCSDDSYIIEQLN